MFLKLLRCDGGRALWQDGIWCGAQVTGEQSGDDPDVKLYDLEQESGPWE